MATQEYMEEIYTKITSLPLPFFDSGDFDQVYEAYKEWQKLKTATNRRKKADRAEDEFYEALAQYYELEVEEVANLHTQTAFTGGNEAAFKIMQGDIEDKESLKETVERMLNQ